MQTPGSSSIISEITSSVNAEGSLQTDEDPPPGFHWVGTKPVLIYDVQGSICGATRPAQRMDLSNLSAQEFNSKVYGSYYYRITPTAAKCLLCPDIIKPIGVRAGINLFYVVKQCVMIFYCR
jgi:hypothetical protein